MLSANSIRFLKFFVWEAVKSSPRLSIHYRHCSQTAAGCLETIYEGEKWTFGCNIVRTEQVILAKQV